MYYKGANLLHTIRQLVDDDEKFRRILRGLNESFYHKTVSTQQVEAYISEQSGRDLSRVFDQYLRTAQVPELEFKADGDKIRFRWTKCVDGFDMPVRLTNGQWIQPTEKEQKIKVEGADFSSLKPDPNFYIRVKK
jgi:aminopeptidase N